MSALIRSRSRLFSIQPRNTRLRHSYEPHREPIVSGSLLGDHPPPTEPSAPTPDSDATEKSSWSLLKFGIFAAFTGGVATAGYATYAYSVEEVSERTKNLRAAANYSVADDSSSFDKFKARLQATAMTVPAKLVEVYLDLRTWTEDQIRGYTEPTSDKLLPDLPPEGQGVYTLVLDLNETLIYSDWKRDRGWRTFKRPGVDAFLDNLKYKYEIVVFSDQLQMYVDPVVEKLDPDPADPQREPRRIYTRLSRGATTYINGKHYKDLSKLNRDPRKVIYISGHALETSLQHENCLEVKPWKGEADDTALLDLIPFLDFVVQHRPADIRTVLTSYRGLDVAKEFIERTKEYERKKQERPGPFWRR